MHPRYGYKWHKAPEDGVLVYFHKTVFVEKPKKKKWVDVTNECKIDGNGRILHKGNYTVSYPYRREITKGDPLTGPYGYINIWKDIEE